MRVSAEHRRRFVLAFVLALGAAGLPSAHTAPPSLKAAFLQKFVMFADWPTEVLQPGTPLALCVVDDLRVAWELNGLVRGKRLSGRRLTVKKMDWDSSLQACHLVYVGGSDLRRTFGLLEKLKGMPVLSVSDAPQFAESGGVAGLFLNREGRMHFSVNADAAARGRLKLSSRLLELAHIVKDAPHASNR